METDFAPFFGAGEAYAEFPSRIRGLETIDAWIIMYFRVGSHFENSFVGKGLLDGESLCAYLNKIEEREAGDMIEMLVDSLHGETRLAAELTLRLFGLQLLAFQFVLHDLAAITVVGFLLRHLLQPIACQVETRVAEIAVQHLVGVGVQTTKTNLAVCLEKFILSTLTLQGFHRTLVLYQRSQHILSFISVSVLKIFQHCCPHELLFDRHNLLRINRFRLTVSPDRLHQYIPIHIIGVTRSHQLTLPRLYFPINRIESPLTGNLLQCLCLPAEFWIISPVNQRHLGLNRSVLGRMSGEGSNFKIRNLFFVRCLMD